MLLIFVISFCLHCISAQEMRSTWPPNEHPGEECVAYDGSKVPDCSLYIVNGTGEPYYHPHSYNCSRFWECGPDLEVCLFECARCQMPQENNPLCQGQWALSYNYTIPWPFGPVCDWPSSIDCIMAPAPCDCQDWQTCINGVCSPQCTEDSHCPDWYYCDDCGWCVPVGDSTPSPTTSSPPTNPTNPPTDPITTPKPTEPTPTPTFEPTTSYVGCNNDNMNCKHELCDEPDNWPYTTCEYCDGTECVPGCPDNTLCPATYPICGHYHGEEHRCGCDENADCASLGSSYICDLINHVCKPEGVSGIINITVATASCDGCPGSMGHSEEGGLQVYLENRHVSCTSDGLDNLELVDYVAGRAAFFDGESESGESENEDGMGGCEFADLNVGLSTGNATWTGSGTWTAAAQIPICINFYGEYKPTCCCELATPSLSNGETSDFTNCKCCGSPPC